MGKKSDKAKREGREARRKRGEEEALISDGEAERGEETGDKGTRSTASKKKTTTTSKPKEREARRKRGEEEAPISDDEAEGGEETGDKGTRSTASKKKKKTKTTRKPKEREARRKRGEEEAPISDDESEGGEETGDKGTRSTASKKKTTTSKPKESEETPVPGSAAFKAAWKRRKRLAKRAAVRAPQELTDEEKVRVSKLKQRKKILCLWDYENLPRPNVGAYRMIKKKLRKEGYRGKLKLHVIVGYVGDPHPEEDKTFTMHYGDPINTRPHGASKGDQKADEHIQRFIQLFLEQTPPPRPQNVLLVTNDNGFTRWGSALRAAKHTVIVATTQDSFELKSVVHEVWNWDDDLIAFL